MPRRKRVNLAGVTQLIVQDAFQNRAIMRSKGDYQFMQYALQRAAEVSGSDIHAYSFNPGQIVILATPNREQGISRLMQSLGKRYIAYRNRNDCPTPRLWSGRHRVNVIENDRFFLVTSHLVERVHLGTNADPACLPGYRSSHGENTGAMAMQILNPHTLYLSLSETLGGCAEIYRQQSEQIDWQRYMGKIRDIVAGRGTLARPDHLKQVEKQAGVRILPRQPGRVAGMGQAEAR